MTLEISSELERIDDSIIRGKYFEALDMIKALEIWENLDHISRMKIELFKIRITMDLGKYQEALKLSEKLKKECQRTQNVIIENDVSILVVEILIFMGEFKKALDLIIEVESVLDEVYKSDTREYKLKKAQLLRMKGICNRATGDQKATEYNLNASLSLSKEIENELEIVKTIDRIAMYVYHNNLKKASELLKESLDIRKKIGNKYYIAQTLNRLGIIYDNKGHLEESLAYYVNSYELTKDLQNKDFSAITSMNIGNIYQKKGMLNSALDYYFNSMKEAKEVDNKHMIAACLYNISSIYRTRGELDDSLEYLKQCKSHFVDLNFPSGLAATYQSMGIIYYSKGDYEKSTDLFTKSYELREKEKSYAGAADSLFYLIILSLDKGLLERAKSYHDKLEQISEKEDNKLVNQKYNIAEALLLKTSSRTPKRAKAEELLRSVIEEEIIDHTITTIAYLNLCDLLLEELRIIGDQDVFNELRNLLDQLFEIAKKQYSFSLMAETYWLKSQLALINLDLKEAKNLLIQAQLIAEEKELHKLALKISREYDELIDQMDKWKAILHKEASISERLLLTNFDKVLARIIRNEEFEIQKLEQERPVMLILLNKDGQTIFTQKFLELTKLDGALIGGFLAAINSFASEIFESTGHIERIKYQDYTLIINVQESLLFTYVYKGTSIDSLNKLNEFVDSVKKSKLLWTSLMEAAKTPTTLDFSVKTTLERKAEQKFL
ncbi:MAG: tetratricopeptide repeat protein [Candidatus Thorarchaeota archaeon]